MRRQASLVRAGGEVVAGDLVEVGEALQKWTQCRQGFGRSGLWPLLFRLGPFDHDEEWLPDNSRAFPSLESFSDAVRAFSVEAESHVVPGRR